MQIVSDCRGVKKCRKEQLPGCRFDNEHNCFNSPLRLPHYNDVEPLIIVLLLPMKTIVWQSKQASETSWKETFLHGFFWQRLEIEQANFRFGWWCKKKSYYFNLQRAFEINVCTINRTRWKMIKFTACRRAL